MSEQKPSLQSLLDDLAAARAVSDLPTRLRRLDALEDVADAVRDARPLARGAWRETWAKSVVASLAQASSADQAVVRAFATENWWRPTRLRLLAELKDEETFALVVAQVRAQLGVDNDKVRPGWLEVLACLASSPERRKEAGALLKGAFGHAIAHARGSGRLISDVLFSYREES
ncbi:MAG: hypothetical protein QM765_30630 [Myxococcales bacterium]